MIKYSLAIMALVMNLSQENVSAVNLSTEKRHRHHSQVKKQHKFAEGYGDQENMNESVTINGPAR